MKDNRILIIEDEESICDILSYALRKEGYTVKYSNTGSKGVLLIETFNPDLIILDIMLPDTNGFNICKDVNRKYRLPIIMLTARNDIVDKVLGLELGADDYITKPFDIRELTARVKTILRRIGQSSDSTLKNIIYIDENIYINTNSRTVYKDEEEIKLKPKEYDLLLYFSLNKDRVFTREELLDKVWDFNYEGDLRTVDVHVQRIRKKLDYTSSSIIETVFGIGYKMGRG